MKPGFHDCCDCDAADIYNAARVQARKRYTCSECHRAIDQGQRYEYVFGVWEGSPAVFRTCARCLSIRDWVAANLPCFCWAHGNVLNDARAAVDGACWWAPDETVGLRFGFLRRLFAAGLCRRTDQPR